MYGRPGLGIFGELEDLYGVEQEVNRVGRNLVGELILKIHGLVGYEHRFSFSHRPR